MDSPTSPRQRSCGTGAYNRRRALSGSLSGSNHRCSPGQTARVINQALMKTGQPISPRDHAAQIQSLLGESWLPEIYRERILKLRTRAYHFGKLPRIARIAIQHTLLGVELKIGRQRFLCPDLATARYLSVFARAGCEDVAIPYDITQISCLADEVESSWQRMLLLV